ncbi:MAG: Gfo/Idh/MocA family protein [Xenococcaceae cyanobacterium]
MKIRIAILGLGRWGIHYVRNFSGHPLVELVAIVDPHPERLAYCREVFAIDETKTLLSDAWESIRDRANFKIDAVIVVTPASTHYALIRDALDRGYHVLAEKPLTLDRQECLELARLEQQKQLQLFVDHTYLFHPAVIKGKEIARSGKIGEFRYAYATRIHLAPVRQDVDVLWDLAIHDIAILNDWLGEMPIEVQATGNVWLQNDRNLADLVWATLTYPNNFQARLHFCWLNPDKQRKLALVGDRGSLIFDELAENPLTIQHGYFDRQEEKFLANGQHCEAIDLEKSEPLAQVCDRFLKNILDRTNTPAASPLLGAELVQILSCLTLSLQQQGKIIKVI